MPDIRPLSEELQEIAKTQLNEDPKRIEDDLKHIKEWLSKQPHITARTDDQFLIAFLRGCKYSLERTKEKLDYFYTFRSTLGTYFNDRNVFAPIAQKILDLGAMLPLPEPDDLGRRVLLQRVGIHDPDEIKITDFFKVNLMLMDYMIMKDDRFITAGVVILLDMSHVTLGHAAQMTPTVVKQIMKCSQDGYPIRLKAVNYIHTPPAFETIFNLFKSFSKEKLKNRLHVHGEDMDSFYKNVPQRILPKEYGGEAGTLEDLTKYWKKEMESMKEWFQEDEKFKSNEAKRPGKPRTYEDLFGVEGSFRQLSVD
ncbi:alpha-tocopherol transfer protein-like [Ischnura elegans]|uniref:alpha-tocopherol transfer protein-like n=1 Tax=Ischnura elegans TaxID=197161 RepID=UPI001ED86735|nr:alpha-tocopherol transfer protein-like [Ischnura elegans]